MAMNTKTCMHGNEKPKTIYEYMKSRQEKGGDAMKNLIVQEPTPGRNVLEDTLKILCAAETVLQLVLMLSNRKTQESKTIYTEAIPVNCDDTPE